MLYLWHGKKSTYQCMEIFSPQLQTPLSYHTVCQTEIHDNFAVFSPIWHPIGHLCRNFMAVSCHFDNSGRKNECPDN